MRTFGIILIIAGLLLALYTGYYYVSQTEAGTGPIEGTGVSAKILDWPPFVGIAVAVVGIILLVTASPVKKYGH